MVEMPCSREVVAVAGVARGNERLKGRKGRNCALDISVKIIDRLTGGNRMRESFWQYRLDCFAPKGLNTRQVDT